MSDTDQTDCLAPDGSQPTAPHSDDGRSAPQADAPRDFSPDFRSEPTNVQPNVQRHAPNGANPPDGRDRQTGRFVPGNLEAFKHGGRSRDSATELLRRLDPALGSLLHERERAILGDMGGREQCSTLAAGLVTRAAQLELLASHLWQTIHERGVLTPSGRTRASVSLFLSVVDRQERLAARLGLARRTKDIASLTPNEWLASQRPADTA